MQPTTEILERISKDSLAHKEEVFTRLYRYLLRPDIYYQACQRLYTNKGASTKGINQEYPPNETMSFPGLSKVRK